ncbi:MAG: ribosome maturation factor RimP [Thermaerobacter sp.]|nr:ribosome maturation factor RimP [Thermaerobacter sp.]
MGESVKAVLQELAAEACRLEGAELWDLRLDGGRGRSIIRVTVEHPEGVTFDLLERVSRRFSQTLDERDPIDGSYTLECESPGLDRVLRSLDDCRRFLGSNVRLRLRPEVEGQRNFRGELASVSADAMLLRPQDGEDRWIPWADVLDLHLDPKLS